MFMNIVRGDFVNQVVMRNHCCCSSHLQTWGGVKTPRAGARSLARPPRVGNGDHFCHPTARCTPTAHATSHATSISLAVGAGHPGPRFIEYTSAMGHNHLFGGCFGGRISIGSHRVVASKTATWVHCHARRRGGVQGRARQSTCCSQAKLELVALWFTVGQGDHKW